MSLQFAVARIGQRFSFTVMRITILYWRIGLLGVIRVALAHVADFRSAPHGRYVGVRWISSVRAKGGLRAP